MNIIDIIIKKKDKKELTDEEIRYVIKNYLDDKIKDYQMSALLMAIVLNGMNEREIITLTKEMANSSDILDMSSLGNNVVDKHSTGGVGDKTTLIITPLVAACGVKVAKMSGKGLGFTGGTIDKLESIPGFKTNLTKEEFIEQINNIGCAITSQTDNIAIADKKIYALRDVTGTVESLPLIASSIMSKKIALGVKKLVLDIKVGNGALIKNRQSAIKLANIMNKIGKSYGIKVVSCITNMNIPLGSSIGNSKEVEEAIEILKGEKENDLTKLCIELSTQMVSLGLDIPEEEARSKVITNLKNKSAYKKFLEFVKYQHGEITKLPQCNKIYQIKANKDGYLTNLSALELGKLSVSLGAGRKSKEDKIDYSVGIELLKSNNELVKKDEVIMNIYSNKEVKDISNNIFSISEEKPETEVLIYDIIK